MYLLPSIYSMGRISNKKGKDHAVHQSGTAMVYPTIQACHVCANQPLPPHKKKPSPLVSKKILKENPNWNGMILQIS